jgi:hypothetical protein
MKKKELRTEFRKVIDDYIQPYGWDDTIVDAYLSEGMDALCEDTGFFIDFSNYTISTLANVASYPFNIDGRIIEVLEVWNAVTNVRLSQFDESDRPDLVPIWDSPATVPFSWQCDQESGHITMYPTPGVDGSVFKLRVWRYERIPFESLDEEDSPLIPATIHRGIIEYAAFKAYMHHDREQANMPKASDHKALYDTLYVPRGKRLFQRQRATHIRCAPNKLYTFR